MSGGSIFITTNKTYTNTSGKFVVEFFNGGYFDSFLEQVEVSLKNYDLIREKILEGQYLETLSFIELNKDDFNIVYQLLNQHLNALSEPEDSLKEKKTAWQINGEKSAKAVWEIIKPHFKNDPRFEVNCN